MMNGREHCNRSRKHDVIQQNWPKHRDVKEGNKSTQQSNHTSTCQRMPVAKKDQHKLKNWTTAVNQKQWQQQLATHTKT